MCFVKSDNVAVTAIHDDDYLKQPVCIKNVPSVERLRQRLDTQADNYIAIAEQLFNQHVENGKANPKAMDKGHIHLDSDVFPINNELTMNEKDGRTSKVMTDMRPLQHTLDLKAGGPIGIFRRRK